MVTRRRRRPGETPLILSPAQRRNLTHIKEVRARWADGVPLTGPDAKFMHAVLTNHPRARQKIGPGIRAIVVHPYIGGDRCFWVIRTDGTAVDFSASLCITHRELPRRTKVRIMMEQFQVGAVFRSWRTALATAQRDAFRRNHSS